MPFWVDMVPDDADTIPIGKDGLAILLLSCAVIGASAGLSFLAVLFYVHRIACRTAATPPVAAAARALVLGLRLEAGGRVAAAYRRRLDRAAALLAGTPELRIVILGGARPGEPSEAAAGRDYLLRRAVAADRILLEEQSRHTLENLRRYRSAFRTAPSLTTLLITSRTHLARSSLMANGLGIAHLACAAEDAPEPLLRALPALVWEAFLVHWYVTGRSYARLTGNRRMTARIS